MTATREWTFDVEAGQVRDFARAVHDDHWRDDPPVPTPTFPIRAAADFVERLVIEELKLDRRRVVHGEEEYEYHRPLRVGTRLACTARIASDTVKQGKRGGSMRIVVFEIEMRDATTGELVLTERSSAIETGASA